MAVKVMKLPEREAGATSAAEELLKKKVVEVLRDFVAEVEVCCDLNHPNLVRLLGYADRPVPMMMQQLLFMSLDKLLYVESWEPALDDQLKVAHDVAMGMEYLHTCFQHEGSNQDQPIIHRDLKTPNLLLTGHPAEGHFDVKITDFGLSRDKGLDDEQYRETVMMTGCGSALWMAPEILLGETYNEKIDVFSCASSCPALCSPLHNPIKGDSPVLQVRDVPGGGGQLQAALGGGGDGCDALTFLEIAAPPVPRAASDSPARSWQARTSRTKSPRACGRRRS